MHLVVTHVLSYELVKKNPVHSYFINDFELPIHTSFKDLGITFNDISFNTHINTICTLKAHLIINRLFRCFITNDYIYLLKVYLSYVRPIVESDSSVWIQTISYAILTIWKIFKSISLKYFFIDVTLLNGQVNFLNIKTLFHRRFHNRLLPDLTLTYKILKGLVDVDETDIFDLYSNNCGGPKVKIRKSVEQTPIWIILEIEFAFPGTRYLLQLHLEKTVTLFHDKLIHTECINHVIVIPY